MAILVMPAIFDRLKFRNEVINLILIEFWILGNNALCVITQFDSKTDRHEYGGARETT